MTVGFARPDVARLVFRLFSRELHPELIDVYAEAEIDHEAYHASLQICDAGHVVTFRHDGQVLCEVATAREHPLPKRRRILSYSLRGHRCESIEQCEGMSYHVSFQLEQLEPEMFLHFHEELLADSRQSQLSHRFMTSNRLATMPLSFIQTEDSPDSLLIHAFHTYPDNYAIVKTQSLFEIG